MVGRGDHHGVDRLVVQHAAQIGYGVIGTHLLLRLTASRFVGVTDVCDIGQLGKGIGEPPALAAATDHSHSQSLVGPRGADAAGPGPRGGPGRGRRGVFQERSSIRVSHGRSPASLRYVVTFQCGL